MFPINQWCPELRDGVASGMLYFSTPRTSAMGVHVGGQSGYLSPSCGSSYRHRSSGRVAGGVTELLVCRGEGRRGLYPDTLRGRKLW